MAHENQMRWVKETKEIFPAFFRGKRIWEIGSKYVNGSVRGLFTNCDYVGLDCQKGFMVDVVCLAHEYRPETPFDVVISCEAFEHDPYLGQTLEAVARNLKSGGLFVATWAGPARKEHGTAASDGNQWGPSQDYYHGISASEFAELLLPHRAFDQFAFGYFRDHAGGVQDVYFWGLRS